MRKRDDSKKEIFQTLFMITQIGLSTMTCMAISMYLGYLMDRFFHTQYIIVIMMFVGIGAAIRSIIVLSKSFFKEDRDKK